MIEPGDSLSLDMVTAALRADSADVAVYARVLTESLGDALPAGWVTIDRDRSVSDRMRGRPGQVSKITVRMGELVMTLGVQRGAPVAEISVAWGGREGMHLYATGNSNNIGGVTAGLRGVF